MKIPSSTNNSSRKAGENYEMFREKLLESKRNMWTKGKCKERSDSFNNKNPWNDWCHWFDSNSLLFDWGKSLTLFIKSTSFSTWLAGLCLFIYSIFTQSKAQCQSTTRATQYYLLIRWFFIWLSQKYLSNLGEMSELNRVVARLFEKSETDSNHFSLFTIQCPVHLQNCIPRISITNISLNLLWEFRDLLEKQIQFMSTWNGDVLRAFRLRFIAARERMSLPSVAPFFSFINNGSIPQFLPPSFYFYSLVIRIFFHFYSASLHWPNHLEMSFWPLLFSPCVCVSFIYRVCKFYFI